MEYTFRLSHRNEVCTLVLGEYELTVTKGSTRYQIPYANIEEVQIEKKKDGVYHTWLYPDQGKSIVISNRFYRTAHDFDDQSRAYATFVRVLHFHLKDKSKAHFTSGQRSAKIGASVSAAILASFTLAFTADYLGIQFIDPFFEGLALAAVSGAGVLLLNLNQWPRTYTPADVPLEFLP